MDDAVDQPRRNGARARLLMLIPVFLVLAVFGLREVGFRDGPSKREVTVHTNGPGGAADFIALESGNPADASAVNALSNAGEQACKHKAGMLKELLGFRGPTAIFVTEITAAHETTRFRWDCRLHVLRMANQ